MPLHPATDQIQLVDQTKSAPAVDEELTVTLHGAQASPDSLGVRLAVDFQAFADLAVIEWVFRFREQLQYQLPAGDGVVVFIGFALGVRIFGRPAGGGAPPLFFSV